jgi:hypothetical protein
MGQEMRELYIEGVATHNGREPCVGAREGAGEASVAVRAGRAIEPRNHGNQGADVVSMTEGHIVGSAIRKLSVSPAWSKNQGMYGSPMRENREVPCSPVWLITGRAAQGRPRPQA